MRDVAALRAVFVTSCRHSPLLAIFGGDALADWGNLTARNRRLARLGRVG